ncbi:MAG: hypothetical protein CVT84_04095, partial [Alphaproteobacteria bacterium HGW-Alphaproteobacteria-6]
MRTLSAANPTRAEPIAADRPDAAAQPSASADVRRHKLSTRLWHWISAALTILLVMSGLMIFNAHPRLYWGEAGAHDDPAWLEIGAVEDRGFLQIGD